MSDHIQQNSTHLDLSRPISTYLEQSRPTFFSSPSDIWRHPLPHFSVHRAHLDTATIFPPHPDPLPLGGGQGESPSALWWQAVSPLSPFEGERAGVRGFGVSVAVSRCAPPIKNVRWSCDWIIAMAASATLLSASP